MTSRKRRASRSVRRSASGWKLLSLGIVIEARARPEQRDALRVSLVTRPEAGLQQGGLPAGCRIEDGADEAADEDGKQDAAKQQADPRAANGREEVERIARDGIWAFGDQFDVLLPPM